MRVKGSLPKHKYKTFPFTLLVSICLSRAFDKIQRDQLINIAKEILKEDEIRIVTRTLEENTLKLKVGNTQTTTSIQLNLTMAFSI